MTQKIKNILLITLFSLGLMGMATASPININNNVNLTIDLNDQEYTPGQRIYLKREIRRENPNLNLNLFQIVNVNMMAKSRSGRGMVELRINNRRQDNRQVNGNPVDYNDWSSYTYDKDILLINRSQESGPWQIIMNGMIKVRNINIRLSYIGPRTPPRRATERSIGTITSNKIITDTRTLIANQRDVATLTLKGLNGTTRIKSVVIQYYNGDRDRLPELNGRIKKNQRVTAKIYGRDITNVIIKSTSPKLNGARGKIQVLLRSIH